MSSASVVLKDGRVQIKIDVPAWLFLAVVGAVIIIARALGWLLSYVLK